MDENLTQAQKSFKAMNRATPTDLLRKVLAQRDTLSTRYKTDPAELLSRAFLNFLGEDVYNRCASAVLEPLVADSVKDAREYYEYVHKNRITIVIKDGEPDDEIDGEKSPTFDEETAEEFKDARDGTEDEKFDPTNETHLRNAINSIILESTEDVVKVKDVRKAIEQKNNIDLYAHKKQIAEITTLLLEKVNGKTPTQELTQTPSTQVSPPTQPQTQEPPMPEKPANFTDKPHPALRVIKHGARHNERTPIVLPPKVQEPKKPAPAASSRKKPSSKRKEAPEGAPRRSKRHKIDDAVDSAIDSVREEEAQADKEIENDETIKDDVKNGAKNAADLLAYLERNMVDDAKVSREIEDYVFEESMYTRDLSKLPESEFEKCLKEIADKHIMANNLNIANVYVTGGVFYAIRESYLNKGKNSVGAVKTKKEHAYAFSSKKCGVGVRKIKYYIDLYELIREFPGFKQCRCPPSLLWVNAVKIRKHLRLQSGYVAAWWKKPTVTVHEQADLV